jgi:hypothetical protein
MALVDSLGKTLLGGTNQPGLAAPVFSYPGSAPKPAAPAAPKPVPNSNDDYAGILAQIKALSAPQPQPLAPFFDTAANFSRARSQAEGAVNPLYTKKLNDFITQQQVEKARQQADATTANANLDDALKFTLESSKIARDRAAEDTSLNVGQLNNQEENYQADQGSTFDKVRQTLAGNVTNAGLQASGLGAQQVADATKARNVQEGRAVESFHVQKQAQETAKNRTFDDLFRSDNQSTDQTGKKKDQIKINLDRFIQDQGTQLDQTKTSLEAQRLGDIINQEGQYAKLGFSTFLGTLRNPRDIALASQTYGGLF